MGFQGEGTSFPLGVLSPFLQRNRAPAGHRSAVPTAWRVGGALFLPVPTVPAGPLVGLSMICYDKPNKRGRPHLGPASKTEPMISSSSAAAPWACRCPSCPFPAVGGPGGRRRPTWPPEPARPQPAVVHAGFNNRPGSMAQLCVEGNQGFAAKPPAGGSVPQDGKTPGGL